LRHAADALAAYNAGKKEGNDAAVLDSLYDQYLATRYKDDAAAYHRASMIAMLDPLRHISNEELSTAYGDTVVSREHYALKLRLSSLIKRFETENMTTLNEFGNLLSINERVAKIRKRLLEYVAEGLPDQAAPAPEEPVTPAVEVEE